LGDEDRLGIGLVADALELAILIDQGVAELGIAELAGGLGRGFRQVILDLADCHRHDSRREVLIDHLFQILRVHRHLLERFEVVGSLRLSIPPHRENDGMVGRFPRPFVVSRRCISLLA
jgi:hypothetical protein